MSLVCFMYHRVLDDHPEGIAPDLFRRQLDYMQSHYRMLGVAEAGDFLAGKTAYRGPCAALSFDDGWCDNLFFAHDILKERGLSAFLAVSAGFLWDGEIRTGESPDILGRTSRIAQRAAREGDKRAFLNRSELRAMENSGVWRLEVHGTRHELGDGNASILAYPQNGMDAEKFRDFLAADLQNARREISLLTNREHRIFFWPWGHYSKIAVETAERCGFDIQFTVSKGAISAGGQRGVLPRIGVSPRWRKFRRNGFVFRHPLLTFLHGFSHREKVCFDDRTDAAR